jgi:mannose-6-phosphate isomerase-like protein (cupin superfamily)
MASESRAARAFEVPSSEGTTLETPTGDWITIKAHTRNTNGSMSVFEIVTEPMSGPGLHTHLREDELWWVLEGEYRFKAGDAIFHLTQGGMAYGPRGVPHASRTSAPRWVGSWRSRRRRARSGSSSSSPHCCLVRWIGTGSSR